MKKVSALSGIILLVLLVASASAATMGNAVGPQVHVTSVVVDPGTFYPFETGTITVTVSNAGNQSASMYHATISDNNIHIKNSVTYNGPMITLGPGDEMTYSFVVSADASAGTYFPLFTISFKDAGSLNYPIKVEVDPTDIRSGIVKKPDNFSLSTKDTINLSIINPRNNDLNTIIITPEGTGVDVSPSQAFISSLPARSSTEVPFTITPHQATNVTFQISYKNGDNKHTTDVTLPIVIGEDKLAVVPIVNNVALTSSGSAYTVTGDINNAGLTDAKSMVVTIGAPARAVEPYAEYAIGSLASDDFSSFELSFTGTDLSAVPLIITWKDNDGNSFSTTKNLNLKTGSTGAFTGTGGSNSGSSGSSVTTTTTSGSAASRIGGGSPGGGSIFGFGGSQGGGISSFYPVIAGGILLIVGIVVYKKRKWFAAKLKRK